MLESNTTQKHSTYGYRFKGKHQEEIAGLFSLGWEVQKSSDYDWHGLFRGDIGNIVLQYTLSGKGEITINDQVYPLETGDAFFVKIPSNHHYYLPATSEKWEFIYITLFGKEAIQCFQHVVNKCGHILSLNPDNSIVKLLLNYYELATKSEITDSYIASSLSYNFIMELYRYASNMDNVYNEWPEPINKAVLFIKKHYSESIGLDDIVASSGLSKYHFTRLFHKTTKYTPVQYLSKTRIDRSLELLRDNQLTIEEVAESVGYANGNYFNKVFRAFIGLPPGKFRKSKSYVPVDYLIMD